MGPIMTSWWVVVQPTVVASTLPNPYTQSCRWSRSNVQSCNSRPTKSIMDITWLAVWHTGGSRIWIDSATFKVQFINITNFEKRAQPFSSILVFWIWVCSHWHVFWCSSSFSWRIFWFEYLLACQSLYLTYYLTPVWVGSSVRLGLGEALCTILNAFIPYLLVLIFLFEN